MVTLKLVSFLILHDYDKLLFITYDFTFVRDESIINQVLAKNEKQQK